MRRRFFLTVAVTAISTITVILPPALYGAYDSEPGRFVERDRETEVNGDNHAKLPVALPETITNLYKYVSNNPVNRVDPSGGCGEPIGTPMPMNPYFEPLEPRIPPGSPLYPAEPGGGCSPGGGGIDPYGPYGRHGCQMMAMTGNGLHPDAAIAARRPLVFHVGGAGNYIQHGSWRGLRCIVEADDRFVGVGRSTRSSMSWERVVGGECCPPTFPIGVRFTGFSDDGEAMYLAEASRRSPRKDAAAGPQEVYADLGDPRQPVGAYRQRWS